MAYLTFLLITAAIYALVALSFNLAFGYAGLINFGVVALAALGSYVFALTTRNLGFDFLPAFLAAGVFSALVALLLSLLTKKIKGSYFGLITLGFAFVVISLLLNLESITRGPFGIAGIPRPALFLSNNSFLILSLAVAAVIFLLFGRLLSSPWGRLIQALRDDELQVKILGKNAFGQKIIVFTLAGLIAGLAGGLLAPFLQFIDPNTFALDFLIIILVIVFIGGLATLKGTIGGTLIVFVITEFLRFLPIEATLVGPLRIIILTLALILIIIKKPQGIWGKIELPT